MGLPRGFIRGDSATFIRRVCFGLAGLVSLGGMEPATAADVIVAEPSSYSYFNVEGGYINLDGKDVESYLFDPDIAPDTPLQQRSLDVTDGYYGRAEIGHVSGEGLLNGIFNGVGLYVYGWDSSKDDVSDTVVATRLIYKDDGAFDQSSVTCVIDAQGCATGEGDLDRSLIEVGVRLFHTDEGTQASGGLSFGIEPFVAFINEDANSVIGTTDEGPFVIRSSDLDATAYGALVALDGRHYLLERTALIGRIAAGGYYMDADADTERLVVDFEEINIHDGLSSDFAGFRGQLAVGIEEMLTDMFSIAVIGRLDYWSDYPTMEWTDFKGGQNESPDDASNNSIASDDLLTLSIGGRISVNFR